MIPSKCRLHARANLPPFPCDVGGELHGTPYRHSGEDFLQDRFSLYERQRPQVSAIQVEDVENDERHFA
jgi:hypothetical protein